MEKKTRFYGFYSEVRSFIKRLLKDPIHAEIEDYLTDRDVDRKRLVNDLLKSGILERSEKVSDGDNGKQVYTLKYRVIAKDFEERMHSLFMKYFGKKKEIDETDCAGVGGSFEMPLMKKPLRRPIGTAKSIVVSEGQMRTILKSIGVLSEDGEGASIGDCGGATSTMSIGDYQYDTPGLVLKTSDGKIDPTLKRKKVNSIEHVQSGKKKGR